MDDNSTSVDPSPQREEATDDPIKIDTSADPAKNVDLPPGNKSSQDLDTTAQQSESKEHESSSSSQQQDITQNDKEAPGEESSQTEGQVAAITSKPTEPTTHNEETEKGSDSKEVQEPSNNEPESSTPRAEEDTSATHTPSLEAASGQRENDSNPNIDMIPNSTDQNPQQSPPANSELPCAEKDTKNETEKSTDPSISGVKTEGITNAENTPDSTGDRTSPESGPSATNSSPPNGEDKDLQNSQTKTAVPSPEAATKEEGPYPKTPRFVYILSALATIGGFLFGYDIGIVAGSMLFIQPYFELSTFWQEAIVSGTIAAAAVAALLSGWLTDKIGRKLTIMTSSVVFTVGGILMAAAPTKEVLLIGRVVAGIGVGLASVVVPVYVAESAPVHIRGRLVSLHQLLINTGIVMSSLIAGGFSYVEHTGWRYMLGMAAVPGVLQFIGFLFMPESPRWLVGRGKLESAKQVLLRMRGGADVSEELNDILVTVVEAEKESAGGIQHFIKIFKTPHVRRALFVGCALLFFQQWCGINTVIYYSGTVLKMAGFPVKYAIWLVTVPNLINFLSSFIGLYLVEKIGRRPLLIISLAGTLIGLIILAVGFQMAAENPALLNRTVVEFYGNGTEIVECSTTYTTCSACVKDNSCGYCYSSETDGTCLPSVDEERASAGRCNASSSTEGFYKWTYEYCPSDFTWIAIVGMAVFVFAFAPGLGPMPWTINSEIYPLWARSTCNSLAACTAWVCNLVISFTFLTMTEHITIHGTFWLFAAITVVGVVFMVVMLPETKNKTLEEMERVFMSSRNWQEVIKRRVKQKDYKKDNVDACLDEKQPKTLE